MKQYKETVGQVEARTGLLALALASATVASLLLTGCNQPEPEKEYEFVCYVDGKLTERHVGVGRVQLQTGRILVWYTDEEWPVAYYPLEGETCGLEEVR